MSKYKIKGSQLVKGFGIHKNSGSNIINREDEKTTLYHRAYLYRMLIQSLYRGEDVIKDASITELVEVFGRTKQNFHPMKQDNSLLYRVYQENYKLLKIKEILSTQKV